MFLVTQEIIIWGYFKYIEDLDMELAKTTCKHPEMATCEQIEYTKEYCTNYRFKKILRECKYEKTN